jgi:hypothetical protein
MITYSVASLKVYINIRISELQVNLIRRVLGMVWGKLYWNTHFSSSSEARSPLWRWHGTQRKGAHPLYIMIGNFLSYLSKNRLTRLHIACATTSSWRPIRLSLPSDFIHPFQTGHHFIILPSRPAPDPFHKHQRLPLKFLGLMTRTGPISASTPRLLVHRRTIPTVRPPLVGKF